MDKKELKNSIRVVLLKDYKLKTNFKSAEFLVEIGTFIIMANSICLENEVKYEFVLNTEFISSKEITYDEIVMIKNVIEILENNRELVISGLKKWTVDSFLKDKEMREKRSEAMLEALKTMHMKQQK